MKIFGITGASGSGKTVLVEQLVPRLKARGLRVSVVKHTHHDVDLDRPGKDSFRQREAGAQEVMVVGPRLQAIFHELRGAPEPTLDELLGRLAPCDVVLVEGYKQAALPKLEVFRPSHGSSPLHPDNPHVVAVASDAPPSGEVSLPWLDLNAPDALADFVVAQLERQAPWGPTGQPGAIGATYGIGAAYGIAGWSGAGKTTLICRVIPELVSRGRRVSVLKHAHKGFDVDQPGKDSSRLRVAGAQEVLLAGPRRWALLHDLVAGDEPSLEACRRRLAACDLLLVEGFKQDALAKLEVFRAAHGRPPMYPDNPWVHGVATDGGLPVACRPGVSVVDLNDGRAVADFLLREVGLLEPGR